MAIKTAAENAPLKTSTGDEGGACPPTLSWRQVLEAFRAQSRPWEVERGDYRFRGRTLGSGPPLYLLNGIGGTYELFALVVWLLRDDFRCVVFDYPDSITGQESADAAGRLAGDLFAAAGLHGDERFSLFATSFGSAVALSAALRDPKRLEGAILQSGFAYRRLSPVERLLIGLSRHLPGQLGQMPLRETIQRHNHRAWFPPFDHSRWEFFLENTGGVSIRSVANRAAMLRRFDLRDRLPEIETPVLLVRSEGDGSVAEACHLQLEAGLPNNRSEWLQGTGHVPYLTHPHRVAGLIRSFFTDQIVGA